MNAVYTLRGNFRVPWHITALSILHATRWADKVYVVADAKHYKDVVTLGLPVHGMLVSERPELQKVWSLYKIETYVMQYEPFFHIDCDVVVRCPRKIIPQPIVVERKDFHSYYASDTMQAAIKAADLPWAVDAYAMGIFGGSDVKRIRDYAHFAQGIGHQLLVNKRVNSDATCDSMIAEQYALGVWCWRHRIRPTYYPLFTGANHYFGPQEWSPATIKSCFKELSVLDQTLAKKIQSSPQLSEPYSSSSPAKA